MKDISSPLTRPALVADLDAERAPGEVAPEVLRGAPVLLVGVAHVAPKDAVILHAAIITHSCCCCAK